MCVYAYVTCDMSHVWMSVCDMWVRMCVHVRVCVRVCVCVSLGPYHQRPPWCTLLSWPPYCVP